jgi:hypothetical protein
MYGGKPPSSSGSGQRYYNQNMLRDACALTSATPQRHTLRQGGLIYSQFYSSVKEVWDAMPRAPFAHDGLEELALDPQIRQAARSIARGHCSEVVILENAYRASKQRAAVSLRDSRKKSFGIREEHRISWLLFQGLLNRLLS